MFKKFYLKVKDEHDMKVKALLIERYQGIYGCTAKWNSRVHEYTLIIPIPCVELGEGVVWIVNRCQRAPSHITLTGSVPNSV